MNDNINDMNQNDELIQTETEESTEEAIDETKDEIIDGIIEEKISPQDELKRFKKSYNSASLAIIIWFALTQVIVTALVSVGYCLIVIKELVNQIINDPESLNIYTITALIYDITQTKEFIIVPILYLVGYLIVAIVSLLVINPLFIYKEKKNGQRIKVDTPKKIRKLKPIEYLFYIAICFGLWGLGAILGNITSFFDLASSDNSLEFLFGNYTFLYLILACFGAPVVEEILCRKMFIDKVAPHGELLACIFSALFFALLHGNSTQFFLAFNMGFVSAIVYTKTRNIWYSIGLHFIINSYACILDLLVLIGFNEEIVTFVWSLVTIIIILFGLIMLVIFKNHELLQVNKQLDFNAKMVLKSKATLILFIVLLVLLISTDISSLISNLLLAIMNEELTLKYLTLLIPPCGIVAFFILFKKIVINNYTIQNVNQ